MSYVSSRSLGSGELKTFKCGNVGIGGHVDVVGIKVGKKEGRSFLPDFFH